MFALVKFYEKDFVNEYGEFIEDETMDDELLEEY